MFKGASPLNFSRAVALRERMIKAEELLWEELRNKRQGSNSEDSIRRELNIADFYCHQLKLVIELDGEIHLHQYVQQYDKRREADIIEMRLHIIRFQNCEVIESIDQVLQKNLKTAKELIKDQPEE